MARAWTSIIAATVGLAACNEAIGPPREPELTVEGQSLRQLRWSPAIGTPSFGARVGGPLATVARGAANQSAIPPLDTYQVSFWAYKGRDAAVEIHYRAPDGTWRPYAQLVIPAAGLYRRPTGELFGDGDSVLITVTLDPRVVGVEFQPTGLAFSSSAPAQFQLWYTGADPDLDGNGTVDSADEQIRRTLLHLWVQEHSADPWAGVSALHSLDDELFTAGLLHFSVYRSGYAVSF